MEITVGLIFFATVLTIGSGWTLTECAKGLLALGRLT